MATAENCSTRTGRLRAACSASAPKLVQNPVAAWFNPIGPTVASTEVCGLPDGFEYLVRFRRHPFAPYYRVLGPIPDGGDASSSACPIPGTVR